MFEPERKQLLRKTKLSKAVKEINSLELQEKVENRYAKLLAENTLIHPVLKKHLRQSILPAVAVYEVLLSAGISKEIAFQVIRSSVLEAARPMTKAFQTAGRWNGNEMIVMESNGTIMSAFMLIG